MAELLLGGIRDNIESGRGVLAWNNRVFRGISDIDSRAIFLKSECGDQAQSLVIPKGFLRLISSFLL